MIEGFRLKDIKTIEDITKGMEEMDPLTLKSTLAYLLKLYVIDKEAAYKGNATAPAGPPAEKERSGTFTELITQLKRDYNMEELKKFTIEGGNVFISLENKKYQLTSDNTKTAPDTLYTEHNNIEPSRTEKQTPPPPGGDDRFRNLEM